MFKYATAKGEKKTNENINPGFGEQMKSCSEIDPISGERDNGGTNRSVHFHWLKLL